MAVNRIVKTDQGMCFVGSPMLATLDDWVEGFWQVYGSHAPLYSRMSDYWMHATNAAQNVAEEVRRGRPHHLVRSLGSAFAWFCTTAKKTLLTIAELNPEAGELKRVGSSYANG